MFGLSWLGRTTVPSGVLCSGQQLRALCPSIQMGASHGHVGLQEHLVLSEC